MAFANLRQSVSRTTTSILQKAGAVEKTVDKSFEEEERKIKFLQSKSETLMKDAKSYLDSLRAMSLAQQRISEAITAFYDDSAVLGLCGLKFKDAMTQLDSTSRTQTDEVLRTTLLEPLGRFVSLFPDVNATIKRRNDKLLDYDALRTRVKKLANSPSDDPSKLPRTEALAADARQQYETLNGELVDEIPKLIDARIGYLDPCFEALIKAQVVFYTESYNIIQPLSKYFEDTGDAEARVQDAMQQMRDLAIVRVAAAGRP